MKKIIVAFIILSSALCQTGIAQNGAPVNPMQKDTWLLNLGVGAATHFLGNGIGFGPGVKVAAEKGMWEVGPGVFTLGGEFGFSYFGYKYSPKWSESWINFMFAARGAYHCGWDVKGLDTYAGVPLGIGFCVYHDTYNNVGEHYGYLKHQGVYPYFGFFLGGSYFFTSSFGINGELGYNSTYANIGVVFRLK
jgi:hypothetical protein